MYKNSTITIEIYDDKHIEWIATDINKPYAGFWQYIKKEQTLTNKEIETILKMLENKTEKLYTEEDWR